MLQCGMAIFSRIITKLSRQGFNKSGVFPWSLLGRIPVFQRKCWILSRLDISGDVVETCLILLG
jgi:hypothetical protein